MMISDGILNINKPQNMTSHDVVSAVRRITGIKRVGHTGTLDPMASGVLPVCIGRSTRIMEYLDADMKVYRCSMLLGVETDTQDIWGTELRRSPVKVSEEEVRDAFSRFSGLITQTPPMYSALKVNGKKLYEYAREGKTVEVKSRKVFIRSLDIEEISLEGEEKTVTFTVECSKGTYVRTLCRDAGEALSCGGTLCALERLSSGIFTIGNAVDLEKLKNSGREQIESWLYPTYAPLVHFGRAELEIPAALRLLNGQPVDVDPCWLCREPAFADRDFYMPLREEFRRAYTVFCRFAEKEVFLGVAFYNEKKNVLTADKIFASAADLIR